MTPAAARSFMLHLLLAWLAVLSARLAWVGARRLRRRAGAGRGALEVAAGLAALGWLGWVLS